MTTMKRGDRVTVTSGPIREARSVVIAVSQRTGDITVQLEDTCRAFKRGDRVICKPYELTRGWKTQGETR